MAWGQYHSRTEGESNEQVEVSNHNGGRAALARVAVYFLGIWGLIPYAIWRLAGRPMLEHSHRTDSDFRNDTDKERLPGTTWGF